MRKEGMLIFDLPECCITPEGKVFRQHHGAVEKAVAMHYAIPDKLGVFQTRNHRKDLP